MTTAPAPVALPPLRALGVLAIAVLVIAAYNVLSFYLHILPLFPGTLVLFYWAAVKHLALRELPWVVLGALGGIFNAALFVVLAPQLGQGGGALVGLLLVIVALYALLVGWLPHLFNNAYMLLLTAAAIPEVSATGRFVGMALSVLLGAAVFGAVISLPVGIARISTRRRLAPP